MTPLLKAIGVGVGVFLLMLFLFWVIARISGQPFITIPKRPAPTLPPTPTPQSFLPFLRQ